MSILGGFGVIAWGCLLFGWFNDYLGSALFRHGAQLVLGPTSIALLAALAGGYYSLGRGRLKQAILWVMATVLLVMIAGVIIGFVNLEIGATVMVASYIVLVASGTLLGIHLLRSEGPRAAAWSFTISGPIFLLTDKLLWEPLNALLGIDITAFLNTVPFAVGMILLGQSILERTKTARSR